MNIESLKSGEIFPDEVYGWSTKTVLAALLLAMILKARIGGK